MTEILAPAGNLECLQAAVNSGADAVYLGLKNFSARNAAGNFEDLKTVIAYAHHYGVKVYAALNTLVKNKELADFFKAVEYCYSCGADAVILQDIFFGKIIKKALPDLPLHLSTQAGVNNIYGAHLAKENGFSRVILARETQFPDIEKISEIIETEVFIQGALCSSFSGNCYFSSCIGGNSGNRGRCMQPCRQKYSLNGKTQNYAISLSDLSVSKDNIKKLEQAGVKSFKIEGRMRSPEYVAAAVNYYKNGGSLSDLKRSFNRNDYTQGYYFGIDKNMISSAVQGHIGEKIGAIGRLNYKFSAGDGCKILRNKKEVGSAVFENGKLNIRGSVKNGDSVHITKDNALRRRLLKNIKPLNIEFAGALKKAQTIDYTVQECRMQNAKCKIAVIDNRFDYDTSGADILIYAPDDYSKIDIKTDKEVYLYLPAYFSAADLSTVKKSLYLFDGIYTDGSYGLKLKEQLKTKLFLGSGVNIFNSPDIEAVKDNYFVLSKELSYKEALDLAHDNAFYYTLGSNAVMNLIYCPFENKCNENLCKGRLVLKDYAGREFPLRKIKLSTCRFEVYNNAYVSCDNQKLNMLYNFIGMKNQDKQKLLSAPNSAQEILFNRTSQISKKGIK